MVCSAVLTRRVHMNFCGRSYLLIVLSLLSGAVLVVAQGTRNDSEYGSLASHDRVQATKRETWLRHGRVIPGQSPAALRYRAYRQKLQQRAWRAAQTSSSDIEASPHTPSTGAWKPLGPLPLASDASGVGVQDYGWVTGRATAVAIDPADGTGNTVYVGGAYGGVWKSTNAGALSSDPSSVTWTPVTDDQPTLAVGSIAIQPQLGSQDAGRSVILAGTGEMNNSGDSYYGLGILRSPDAGNNWTLVPQDASGAHSFAGLGFSKIAFSAVNPNVVVAAAGGATRGVVDGLEDPARANRGLYYSTDGGQSWGYAPTKDAGQVIDPSSATSVVYNAVAGQFFAAIQWHGVYSSSDGVNWNRLNNQPGGLSPSACPASPASTGCPLYRGEFAVVPGRNEMYFWFVDGNGTDQLIWQTKNAGVTWTHLNNSGITNCGDLMGGCGTELGTYNLELAAMPDGETTDLYAGAVNLYKCRITISDPTCNGTPPDNFMNLTHAFGCPPNFGSIAHVHPNQHSLAFLQINNNTQVVMYFATDGGIYRALDGYSGLTTGTCGGSNHFDSLNETLGSMTQFISFSQHPTDANTILGGAGDNCSPATSESQSNTGWVNVNAGDGGYNQINQDNPTEWFTANADVSIQRCNSGVDCRTQDFENGLVVSNATVGGDSGAFFTPFILDPQNSSELMVGTCRMWRGETDGGGFSLLSRNFETGGTETCTGNEVNLVRSLAAGGIKSTQGLSNVLYAGTDGLGPGTPTGGRVWVTTNASGGPGTWFDRTGATNPGAFPISAIALDKSDATGKTAYISIMGFHVSHVWKTIDAGNSWTDFTANLPDAPANALLVDEGASTIYVGTDVGVFASSAGTPNWTETGPETQSGQSGYLPNTAVTALRMFNFGGTKKLRASTYGRGIWEFTLAEGPDFEFAVADSTLTSFVGETASFSMTLTAQTGYNSPVNLTCTRRATAPPPSCSVTPSSVTPISGGATFSVKAGGPVGDYLFNAHGMGSDANTITRDFALTLHVVDYSLTAPTPGKLMMNQSSVSGPVVFQVTASGAFDQDVTLSCGGLPTGASCSFLPSGASSPTSGIPAAVTLTVTTGATTPAGTYAIAINASAPGAPSRTQNLSLTVQAAIPNTPDFALTVSNSPVIVGPNESAVFNGTIQASGGYASPVNLACAGNLPVTCTASPTKLTPATSGTAFTITASSDVEKTYDFNITATGTDAAHATHSTPVELVVGFNFVLNNNSSGQTIAAGQSASYSLDAAPVGNGSLFPGTLSLSCSSSDIPPLSTCSFTPTLVAAGSGDTNVRLNIVTTAAVGVTARLNRTSRRVWYDMEFSLIGVVLAFAGSKVPAGLKKNRSLFVVVAGVLLSVLVACGGGGSSSGNTQSGGGHPGTPAGSYTITVTGAVGSVTRSTQVMLTVQ